MLYQVHEGGEEAVDFLKTCSEWRYVLLLGNKEMNGKEKASRLEPAVKGFGVFVSSRWVDGTKKGMLENQIKSLVGRIVEEVSGEEGKAGFSSGLSGFGKGLFGGVTGVFTKPIEV